MNKPREIEHTQAPQQELTENEKIILTLLASAEGYKARQIAQNIARTIYKNCAQNILKSIAKENTIAEMAVQNDREHQESQNTINLSIQQFRAELSKVFNFDYPQDNSALYSEIIHPLHLAQIKRAL